MSKVLASICDATVDAAPMPIWKLGSSDPLSTLLAQAIIGRSDVIFRNPFFSREQVAAGLGQQVRGVM